MCISTLHPESQYSKTRPDSQISAQYQCLALFIEVCNKNYGKSSTVKGHTRELDPLHFDYAVPDFKL